MVRVGKSAPQTRLPHLLDVAKHPGPVKTKTEGMKSPTGVQVPANCICVEGNEEYVVQLLRNQLEA
jgi:hypothetical protein